LALLALAGASACQGPRDGSFGAVGAMDHALKGQIYLLPDGSDRLPNFAGLKPIGTVYVRELNVADQDWQDGFPGLTDRYEWFAIDYRGQVQVAEAGRYAFTLTSDDGSRLLIDGKRVIDNDGVHKAQSATGAAQLSAGAHAVEVQYFQGPRDRVALRLTCQRPGQAAAAAFPRCGMALKTPGLSLVWLLWLALVAAVGAAALWMAWRRVAAEARAGPPRP
jgi:hypothetical protein